MDCISCDHTKTCEILGECMHSHDLVNEDPEFKKQVRIRPHKNRLSYVLRYMKGKRPFRVSETQSWKDLMNTIYEKFECHRDTTDKNIIATKNAEL